MKTVAITVLIILMSFGTFLVGNTQKNVNVFSPGAQDDPLSNLCWVLLLCVFSVFVRTRNNKRLRYHFLSIVFFLLILAAFHSHPLWSFAGLRPSMAETATSRIITVPSVAIATGLQLDERVTSMAFDPGGKLWLSSGNESPTIYDTATNTGEDILAPGPVYGLYGDGNGTWVLTSRTALRYSEGGPVERVDFPKNAAPLCALRWKNQLYFGTTQGLFLQTGAGARHVALSDSIYQLAPAENSLLLAGDNGLWRFDGQRCDALLSAKGNHGNVFGALSGTGTIFAPTDSDGIMIFSRGRWSSVRFAKAPLNMASRGATLLYHGAPFVGTMEGSIVYLSRNEWKRIRISNSPVTALANDGNALYAWTAGSLMEISQIDL